MGQLVCRAAVRTRLLFQEPPLPIVSRHVLFVRCRDMVAPLIFSRRDGFSASRWSPNVTAPPRPGKSRPASADNRWSGREWLVTKKMAWHSATTANSECLQPSHNNRHGRVDPGNTVPLSVQTPGISCLIHQASYQNFNEPLNWGLQISTPKFCAAKASAHVPLSSTKPDCRAAREQRHT